MIQNEELVQKLCIMAGCEFDWSKEENVHTEDDILSMSSELTGIISKVSQVKSSRDLLHRRRQHRRLSSDSKSIVINASAFAGHKRAPTCPPAFLGIFDFTLDLDLDDIDERSAGTCDTVLMTASDFAMEKVSIGCDKSLVGRDISLSLKRQNQLDCYDVYISFGGGHTTFDASTRVLKQVNNDGKIHLQDIRRIVSESSQKHAKKNFVSHHVAICKNLLELPSFHVALLYAVGGFLFTIGACNIGLSSAVVQNLFLSGSSVYLCGSAFVMYKTILNASKDWALLQTSRSALYHKAFCDVESASEIELVNERPKLLR